MKHIILISIDNLRFDCIGYQPAKKELMKYDVSKYLQTPTLDRIAEKALCFTQCISTNTYTTAAHASAFTGLYPPRHGARAFYETKISKDAHTLAEVLKIFGYETVMMTDTANLFRPLELNRGFDHFFHKDDPGLLEFLEKNKEGKLFVFAHFFDVHEPFLLCENKTYDNSDYRKEVDLLYEKLDLKKYQSIKDSDKGAWRRLVDHLDSKDHEQFFPLYVRGVSKFDRGRFSDFMSGLENMAFLEDSLLVIFSDHGEGKSNTDRPEDFAHGGMLFDSVIRVPLILYKSDIGHKIINETVSIVDIFPTILNLSTNADIHELLPYELDGISLSSLTYDNDRTVYSETWQRDNKKLLIPMVFISSALRQRAVRSENVKYLVNGTPDLFSAADAVEKMSSEVFLQNVYRGLLRRFEEYDEYYAVLSRLNEKRLTKEGFLKHILSSSEFHSKPPYALYDLGEDPFEENPVSILNLSDRDSETVKHFDSIKFISSDPVTSDEIFPGDRSMITDIVRTAGKEDWQDKANMLINNRHLLSCIIDDFIVQHRNKDLVYNRKNFEQVVLRSREFSLFLNERMSKIPSKSIIKNIINKCVPYPTQLQIWNLLSKRIFPRETMRGRMWDKLLSRILNY